MYLDLPATGPQRATLASIQFRLAHYWRADLRHGPPRGQSGRPVILTGRIRPGSVCESGMMVETAEYGWWDLHWFVTTGAPDTRDT